MPIFFSIFPTDNLFLSPNDPSSFIKNFGTTNSDMPFTPFGASGVLARTKCIIFFDKSWSPEEINIFCPVS